MEGYLEDNRPILDEVCMEYEECMEECPAYEFCHSKTESEDKYGNISNCSRNESAKVY